MDWNMTLNKSFEIGKLYSAKIGLSVYENKRSSILLPDPFFIQAGQPFMIIAQNITYYGNKTNTFVNTFSNLWITKEKNDVDDPSKERQVYSNIIIILVGKSEYRISLYHGVDYGFKQIA